MSLPTVHCGVQQHPARPRKIPVHAGVKRCAIPRGRLPSGLCPLHIRSRSLLRQDSLQSRRRQQLTVAFSQVRVAAYTENPDLQKVQ